MAFLNTFKEKPKHVEAPAIKNAIIDVEANEKQKNKILLYECFNNKLIEALTAIKEKYPKKKQPLFDAIFSGLDEMINTGKTSLAMEMWMNSCTDSHAACMRTYSEENVEYFFSNASKISILAPLNILRYRKYFDLEDLEVLWEDYLRPLQGLCDMMKVAPVDVILKLQALTTQAADAGETFENEDGEVDINKTSEFLMNLLAEDPHLMAQCQEISAAMLVGKETHASPPPDFLLKQLSNLHKLILK